MQTHPADDGSVLRGRRSVFDTSRTDQRIWGGDGDAIVGPHGDGITYDELRTSIEQTADGLRRAGIGGGDLLVVAAGRSIATVVGLFATWRAGAVAVPVDTAWPAARVHDIVDLVAPAAVLTNVLSRERFPSGGPPVWLLDESRWATAHTPVDNAARSAGPDGAAYVMFTSGSTGRPKGVVVSHRALGNYLSWRSATVAVRSGMRFLAVAPVATDVMLRELVWPLTVGASVVLAPDEARDDAAELVCVLREERINVAHLLPAVLDLAVNEPSFSRLPHLQLVHASTEPLPGSLVRRFRERSQASLHHSYGPTEAAVSVTFLDCTGRDVDDLGPVPLGAPIANVDIHVLDEQLRPVPRNEVGEICISGASLADGYWNEQALTEKAFVPHPTLPGERLYRTGDRGRVEADGTLRFLGRRDDQLKVRGYRIEPAEVENALRAEPGVSDALVTADESGSKLLALVVGRPPVVLNATAIRDRLAQRLPQHLLPSQIYPVDALPRTDAGKVDRPAATAVARSHARTGGSAPGNGDAGVDGIVATTRAVWRAVFAMPELSGDEDFFDIGGNSLLAMRIASRLRRQLGQQVPARMLFNHPTADSLAEAIRSLSRDSADAERDPVLRG